MPKIFKLQFSYTTGLAFLYFCIDKYRMTNYICQETLCTLANVASKYSNICPNQVLTTRGNWAKADCEGYNTSSKTELKKQVRILRKEVMTWVKKLQQAQAEDQDRITQEWVNEFNS